MRALTLCLALALAFPAMAAEPIPSGPNDCPAPGGQGTPCNLETDCALNPYATICVQHTLGVPSSRRCEIPCEAFDGGNVEMDRSACAIGETCREGKATPGRKAFFCQPSAFRVDLNLLDQAVVHHIEGLQPALFEGQCSLEANLNALLDQNGDKVYDIFDLDLVVLAFLEQPGCDPGTGQCEAPDLVPCAADDDCGKGLYCSEERHTCQRDCGIVAAREELFEELERQCTGALKVCDYQRGRCHKVDVTKALCETDSQCPAGAYCLVGRCAPMCYGAAQCPGTDWYCTDNNRCRALPHPSADAEFEFDPHGYAVRFARDELKLDAIDTSDSSQLVIMDLIKRKQVVANPSVTFGYRLELSYSLKQSTKCLQPFVDCSNPKSLPQGETQAECEARQDDCYVDTTEQWIQLASPFGTISAVGDTGMAVLLDEAVADKLTPGTYSATLRAIFDNGDSDSIRVVFVKASPSGEYSGALTVTYGGYKNALNGNRPLVFGMRMELRDEVMQWNQLMAEHNLTDDDDITDLTSGQLVHGQLHGSTALAFSRGGALTTADDEIPFVGLYSPELGRIRMVGVIEVPAGFCITTSGEPCALADEDELRVRNLFGRTVRRKIELIGPFDEARALFHGMYREKISGVASDFDVTIEGGFQLSQIFADDSELELDGPLLPAGAPTVGYPSDAQVRQEVDLAIATWCLGGAADDPTSAVWAQAQFATEGAFGAYLEQARRSGQAHEHSVLGKTTVFPALRQFENVIEDALVALGTDADGQQEHLNIYDFVSSQLLPCDPDDPSPPPVCVDEEAVRCGLALHAKAILEGWVDMDELKGTSQGEQVLFCIDTIPLAGCPAEPGGQQTLFALQEHGRFWRDLGQILKYDADRARSDAFLVLYRNEVDPFSQGAALSYKAERLRHAMQRYDELLEVIVGPAGGKVLFQWPALAFQQIGYDWLGLMHTIVSDRMGALAELVDLERRVFSGASETDYVFAHHMMQQEYLVQVYLAALQAHWQKEQFAYLGQAGQLLEAGQRVLSQLDPDRNAIGVQPQVVFFENANTHEASWEHYRSILAGDGIEGGLIGEAKDTATEAVEQLQAALQDMDTLQTALVESKWALDATLVEICGDPDPKDPSGAEADYCQYLMGKYLEADEWVKVRDCKLNPDEATDCPDDFSIACLEYENGLEDGANNCEDVVQTFTDVTDQVHDPKTGNPLAGAPRCLLDKDEVWLDVDGVQRACVGGAMGALLQEKALVDQQRTLVIGSVETLLMNLNAFGDWSNQATALDVALKNKTAAMQAIAAAIDVAVGIGDGITEETLTLSEGIACIFIVGFSNGTDCPQELAAKTTQVVTMAVWDAVKVALDAVKAAMDITLDQLDKQNDLDQGGIADGLELMAMEREIDDLLAEYAVLTQQSLNLGAQIEDLRYQAQFAADSFGDEVSFVADHLVGRETGSVLRGDALVRASSQTFLQILQYAYRLVMAFAHHYNLTPAEAELLTNQAQAMVTLDDAETLVALLEAMAEEYCGKEGIDCDWGDSSNAKVLRYSMRDLLFPSLHDIVDAKSGKVVTAGQQFHNVVTQPPYLKRRVRGVHPTDQVELPFSVPVTLMENTADGAKWLINPLECNQHLAGGEWESVTPAQEGTVAVQVIGKNLGDGSEVIEYELVRGGIDFLRACHPESVIEEIGSLPVLDYPIRKHMVGYAPQSPQALEDTVPAFVTRSAAFPACLAEQESLPVDELLCWRTFARDRALSGPDYKLVIPLYVGGGATDSAWITGEGLPEEARPVVEDIVVYFRYTARPIEEP